VSGVRVMISNGIFIRRSQSPNCRERQLYLVSRPPRIPSHDEAGTSRPPSLLMGLRPFDPSRQLRDMIKLSATPSPVGQVLQRISSLFHVTWHLGVPRTWLARLALTTGPSHPQRGTIPLVIVASRLGSRTSRFPLCANPFPGRNTSMPLYASTKSLGPPSRV
jgi:hypothetical protein